MIWLIVGLLATLLEIRIPGHWNLLGGFASMIVAYWCLLSASYYLAFRKAKK